MRDHVGAAEVLSVLRVVSSYNSLTDELLHAQRLSVAIVLLMLR